MREYEKAGKVIHPLKEHIVHTLDSYNQDFGAQVYVLHKIFSEVKSTR